MRGDDAGDRKEEEQAMFVGVGFCQLGIVQQVSLLDAVLQTQKRALKPT